MSTSFLILLRLIIIYNSIIVFICTDAWAPIFIFLPVSGQNESVHIQTTDTLYCVYYIEYISVYLTVGQKTIVNEEILVSNVLIVKILAKEWSKLSQDFQNGVKGIFHRVPAKRNILTKLKGWQNGEAF